MTQPPITIPEQEIVERFVRATGPGGQNVNKVSTAVELRCDIANSPSLHEPVRERLLARRDRRVTTDGVLVLTAPRSRNPARHRQDTRAGLAHLLRPGLQAPKIRSAACRARGGQTV